MQRFGWLVLAGAATACGSGSGGGGGSAPAAIDGVQVMEGFDPGAVAPAPADGFQVIAPIVNNVKQGASDEWCTWTNVTMTEDIWANVSLAKQTETGHHVILFYTMDPQPAGTSRICTDQDMASLKYGMLGGGGESVKATLPGTLAVHLPKGAQMVLNHHYVNATAAVMPQAQSALTVWYDTKKTFTPAGSFVVMNSAMTIPPGKNSIRVSCSLNHDFPAWIMIPHMHQYGQHITVDHAMTTTTKRLVDSDWTPAYMFHPPETNFDPATPYMFHEGDQIKIQCDFDNTTSGNLTFGPEMCLFFTGTVDTAGNGNLDCDQGVWSPY